MMSPENPITSPESSSSRLPFEVETPCVHCGYSLRGLATSGRCPECGSPVADSTRGDRLRFAPLKWLNAIRLGFLLRLCFILLTTTTILAEIPGGASHWVFYVSRWMGLVLWFASSFLITVQEPRAAMLERGLTLRRAIRGSAVIWVVYAVFAGYVQLIVHPFLYEILKYTFGASWMVAILGELVLIRRYALRALNIKLARSTRNCFRVLLPIGLTPILCNLASALIDAITKSSDFAGTLMTILMLLQACFLIMFLVICFPWYVWILIRYYRTFRGEMRIARSYESAPLPE